MEYRFVIYNILFFILLVMASCKHDPDIAGIPIEPPLLIENCDPDTVYFQNEILPLLISSCGVIGCHDPGTATEGVILTNYASIMQTAEVRPGQPDESDLYEVLTEDDPEDRMPPSPRQSLSLEQIAKIEKWILQGAKNNVCFTNNCDTIAVSYSNHIDPLIQNTCVGCHSGNDPSGGIVLSNYDGVVQVALSGRLLGSVRHEAGFSAMPKNGNKLTDCQITQIKNWIENGTPDN